MTNRKPWRLSRVALCLVIAALANASCKQWTQRGARGIGLLRKARPDETDFSSYRPQNPFSQLAPGMMTRTLYKTAGGGGLQVEVRDLLVGPQQHTGVVTLPGSAVCEIRFGRGVLTAGGKGREFDVGTTFVLADSESFTIENKSDSPVTIRVHLFKGE